MRERQVIVEKDAQRALFSQMFAESTAAYVVEYQGCTCQKITALRQSLKPNGAKFSVIKNTIAKRAVADTAASDLSALFKGPSAVIWTKSDPVTAAKVLRDFAKDNETFKLKGGVVDGKVVDASGIKDLASLPSKAELYGKLLGLLNAPAVRLLQVINDPASSLARLLSAWEKKQSGSSGGDAA